ncbi:hypothetical protein [Methylobacter sp.]|uniref:hypothetical protein n=1 Tax=Methylobacter sp. TaxID=2051955 RepID=UPI002FDD85D8
MHSLIIRFIILLGLFVSTFVIAAPISNDRVFAFAEANYPSLFPGTATDQQFQQYNYRYYPVSGNYLAVDTSGVIFMLGSSTKNILTSVGPVANFESAITAWEATLPGTGQKIQGLSATQQADGTLYFRGTYQNSAVRFTHQGNIGQGKWDVYSGTSNDRTRVTISDTEGLKEALLMDNGQRMTVNIVGTERIEYRNYSNDRKFLFGSVLYRNGDKWLQGLMFTEAFSDYTDLVTVTDVTSQITKGLEQYSMLITPAVSKQTRWFDLILSPAYADLNLSLTNSTISGFIWDNIKAVAFVGAGSIKGIVTTTIGIANSRGVVATTQGVIIAGAITLLGAPAVTAATIIGAGYLLGSFARDYVDNHTVAVSNDSESDTKDYLTVSSSTTYTEEDPIPAPIQTVISQEGERCSTDGGVTYGVIQNNICVLPPTCILPEVLLDNVCVIPVSSVVTTVVSATGSRLTEGGSNTFPDGSIEKVSCTTPISAKITINIDFEKLEITQDHIWSYGRGVCSAPNHQVTPSGPDKFRWVTPFTITENLLNSKNINGTLSKTGITGKYIYHGENKQYAVTWDLNGQFEVLF